MTDTFVKVALILIIIILIGFLGFLTGYFTSVSETTILKIPETTTIKPKTYTVTYLERISFVDEECAEKPDPAYWTREEGFTKKAFEEGYVNMSQEGIRLTLIVYYEGGSYRPYEYTGPMIKFNCKNVTKDRNELKVINITISSSTLVPNQQECRSRVISWCTSCKNAGWTHTGTASIDLIRCSLKYFDGYFNQEVRWICDSTYIQDFCKTFIGT